MTKHKKHQMNIDWRKSEPGEPGVIIGQHPIADGQFVIDDLSGGCWEATFHGVHELALHRGALPNCFDACEESTWSTFSPQRIEDLKSQLESKHRFLVTCYAPFDINYLKSHVRNWEGFCADRGLDAMIVNEEAAADDVIFTRVALLRKHGITV